MLNLRTPRESISRMASHLAQQSCNPSGLRHGHARTGSTPDRSGRGRSYSCKSHSNHASEQPVGLMADMLPSLAHPGKVQKPDLFHALVQLKILPQE